MVLCRKVYISVCKFYRAFYREKIIVRKANIIYPAENFYCAGIVMSESLGKFRNIPPRVTADVRAGRREPQTATEKLSQNIVKRWRMSGTRRSHGK